MLAFHFHLKTEDLRCYLKWLGLSFDLPVLNQMYLTPLDLHGCSGCLRTQGRIRPEGKAGWEREVTRVSLWDLRIFIQF